MHLLGPSAAGSLSSLLSSSCFSLAFSSPSSYRSIVLPPSSSDINELPQEVIPGQTHHPRWSMFICAAWNGSLGGQALWMPLCPLNSTETPQDRRRPASDPQNPAQMDTSPKQKLMAWPVFVLQGACWGAGHTEALSRPPRQDPLDSEGLPALTYWLLEELQQKS